MGKISQKMHFCRLASSFVFAKIKLFSGETTPNSSYLIYFCVFFDLNWLEMDLGAPHDEVKYMVAVFFNGVSIVKRNFHVI